MAIGLGLALGFSFPRNFNLPYVSRSITEFWRRWHISLSQWLRDYLYIPLGGNRGTSAETYRNLCLVFLACGLWHGANWTFVIWGVHHGAFLVIERAGFGRALAQAPVWVARVYALAAIMSRTRSARCAKLTKAALGKRVPSVTNRLMEFSRPTTRPLAPTTGLPLAPPVAGRSAWMSWRKLGCAGR